MATATWAQAQQAEPWPEQLRHRNARYANLSRDLDSAGDQRERVLADLITRRETDPLGDREELRRAIACRHEPPRATAHAEILRHGDLRGDQRERFLATLPKARLHAELRRFRDLRGDEREFAKWELDRIRHGPLRWTHQGTMLGNTAEFNARRDYREARDDEIRRRQREEDDEEDRIERRLQQDEEQRLKYLLRRQERQIEESIDEAMADAEGELEREIDKLEDDLEDQTDRDLDKLEDDSERALEKDEARLERDQERDVERQIQQEEENTLDPQE